MPYYPYSYARQQELHPAPYAFRNDRPIFELRGDFGHLKRGVGSLRICDFSAAVFGNVPKPHNHDIQPQPFCAPEVLLKAGWTYSADIWNLGVVLWELLADVTLFDGLCQSGQHFKEMHLAQMMKILGPIPPQLLSNCDPSIRDKLFSPQENYNYSHLIPSEEFSLSILTPFLHGEDKRLCVEFVLKMLQWELERRLSAKKLYNDPWLHHSS
ncbi:unnamed protein product [Penicillium bialowiezense]